VPGPVVLVPGVHLEVTGLAQRGLGTAEVVDQMAGPGAYWVTSRSRLILRYFPACSASPRWPSQPPAGEASQSLQGVPARLSR
jgi:hypothetical protein